MATITAAKSGNWSDTTVWTGGVLPGAAGANDNADSNGYTVTIDQNIALNGGALIGTSAGAGGFAVTAARTIAAVVTATARTVLTCSHATGTVALTGNVTGGSTAAAVGVANTAAGTLTIAGTVTGGSANNAFGASVAAGVLSITGAPAVVGGSIAGAYGARVTNAAGTLNVTGAVNGATTIGIVMSVAGILNITGDVTGGSGASVYGVNPNNGTTTITGNATGGSGNLAHGVYAEGTATTVVTGTATGAGGAEIRYTGYGAYNVSTGSMTVGRAKGGASAWMAGVYGAVSGGPVKIYEAEYGANGVSPTAGYVTLINSTARNVVICKNSAGGADISLSQDYPATTDVKSGVTYKLTTLLGTLTSGGVLINPGLSGGLR